MSSITRLINPFKRVSKSNHTEYAAITSTAELSATSPSTKRDNQLRGLPEAGPSETTQSIIPDPLLVPSTAPPPSETQNVVGGPEDYTEKTSEPHEFQEGVHHDSPNVRPSLKKSESQDSMSQTPNIAVETFSYGDNTGPETTETGEPSSQKDTPEDRAEQLWSHALELLQEKLSDQEAAAWSAAIRSNMPRVRQYSVAMAKDSFDRAYRPKPGCVVDAVDEMIAHLRLVMVEPDLEDGGDEEEEEDQETEEVKEEEEEGEDEDQGEGQNGAESDENKAGTGMPSKAQKEKKMRSHDQLMAKVLQTYPYAAIVWAVSLATLKVRYATPPFDLFFFFIVLHIITYLSSF